MGGTSPTVGARLSPLPTIGRTPVLWVRREVCEGESIMTHSGDIGEDGSGKRSSHHHCSYFCLCCRQAVVFLLHGTVWRHLLA